MPIKPKLLDAPAPRAHESLNGYLSHVATECLLGQQGDIAELAGLGQAQHWYNRFPLVCYGTSVALDGLADLTGHDVDLLNATRLLLDPPPKKYTDLHINTKHWRFCPACLTEGGGHHKLWSITWVTACPSHGIQLVDACRVCETQYIQSKCLRTECDACGANPATCMRPALPLEIVVSSRIFELAADTGARADLQAFLDIIHLAATVTGAGELWSGHCRLTPQHWTCADAAGRLKSAWPLVASADERRAAFREIFAARLATWPTLGMRAATGPAKLLLSNSPLAAAKEWKAELDSIAAPKLKLKAALPDEILGTVALARILDTSPQYTMSLLKAGHLKCIKQGKTQKMTTLHSAEAFMARLRGLSGPVPPVESCPIGSLVNALGVTRPPFERVVNAVLDGSVGFHLPDGGGFGSVLVDVSNIRELTTPNVEIPADLIGIPAAAKLLNIYPTVVYRLIAIGKIKTVQWTKGGVRKKMLRTDLEGFCRDYVLVSELGRRHNANPTNLAEKIMAAGAAPYSGPSIDGGLVYVFRRPDIERLDMKKVVALTSYPTRTGRKSAEKHAADPTSNLLDSHAACVALGITAQQLGRLVKAGLLVPHQESYKARNCRYFTAPDIADYKARFRHNPDLVPLRKAIGVLGSTEVTYSLTWGRTGLISRISDGIGRTYVAKTELLHCHQLRKSYAFLADAAAALGVSKDLIAYLKAQKRLDGSAYLETPGGLALYHLATLEETIRKIKPGAIQKKQRRRVDAMQDHWDINWGAKSYCSGGHTPDHLGRPSQSKQN